MLGWLFLGLGAAGVFLPLLPTTPFLVLSLGAFSRSSARLEAWLLAHRVFGPPLEGWRRHRVIPLRAKLIAWSSMLLSLGVMLWSGRTPWWAILITASVMAYGVYFVARCPSRAPEPE